MKKTFYFLKTLLFLCWMGMQLEAPAQRPILSLQNGHSKNITHLDVSSDSKFILSSAADNTAKLWDSRTGKLMRTLDGHSHFVSSACFASKGNKAYTASWDKTIKLWDLYSGKCLKTFNCSQQAITSLSISKDQNTLAFSTTEGQVILIDANTGTELLSFKGAEQVAEVAFYDNGKLVAGACDDNVVRIWDTQKGKTVQVLKGASSSITHLKFVPGKAQLAGISDDNCLRIWDITKSRPMQTVKAMEGLEGNLANLCSFAFNGDGSRVWASSDDGLLVSWDCQSGKQLSFERVSRYKIENLLFAPDSSFLLSTSSNYISIRQPNKLKTETPIRPVSSIVNCVSFSSDKRLILSASANGFFRLIDAATGRIVKSIEAHDFGCEKAIFSPDQKYILTCGKDKLIKLWDANSYQLLRTYEGHTDVVTSICFRADGKYFASGSADNSVKFWDTASGKLMRDYTEHTARVTSVSISPDGTSIASASADQSVKIWDIEKGNMSKSIDGHTNDVWAVCYSSDGKWLASASADKTVKLWNAKDYSLSKNLEGHSDYVFNLEFSPKNDQLASASWDKTIRIWNLQSSRSVVLSGHQNYVRSVGFSPDGQLLVSASTDTQMKIWDSQNGIELLNFLALDNGQDFVVTCPNGLFDGTEKGIQNCLHYVQGFDILPLESFYEKFYSPNLWKNVLTSKIIVKPEINVDNPIKMPPLVRFQIKPGEMILEDGVYQTNKSEISITVEAVDQGGGIDEIRLYLNDKLCETTSRGFKLIEAEGDKKTKTFNLILSTGENVLKATAFNKDRTESVPASITVNYKGMPTPPDLYVISIGINQYKNASMNLNYASADAKAFEEALLGGAKNIFKKITLKKLNDEEFTKNGMNQVFAEIAQAARPEDVFVFYYAGHGVTAEDPKTTKSEFYIVPHDVTQLYGAEEALASKGISSAELQELTRKIKAQKQLIIFDACQSGEAVELLATRGSAEQKAIVQLARSAGVAILAASGSEQLATEVAELGHGIFTYALVEALNGKSEHTSEVRKVTVNQIRTYLEDRVPELTQKYRGKPQYPTGYCKGQDFPISIAKP